MSAGGVLDVTDDFMVEDVAPAGASRDQPQLEGDPHRLAQRQKQIDLGKNTLGYQRYRDAVPRERRNRKTDPVTPDVYQLCSKRAFEGQVKKWRRMLHEWDPQAAEGEPALLPVVADLGPASNPPPPAAEQSDDFEHISHEDAASPGPKNGRQLLRPAGSQLPLKLPSAARKGKRAYNETLAAGSNENQHPQQQHPRYGAPPADRRGRPATLPPERKQQRRWADPTAAATEHSTGPGGVARPAPAGRPAAQAPPKRLSWAEQRYEQPMLDYGEELEEEGGWEYVEREAAAPAPATRYATVTYNNPAADGWNEDDIQV